MVKNDKTNILLTVTVNSYRYLELDSLFRIGTRLVGCQNAYSGVRVQQNELVRSYRDQYCCNENIPICPNTCSSTVSHGRVFATKQKWIVVVDSSIKNELTG